MLFRVLFESLAHGIKPFGERLWWHLKETRTSIVSGLPSGGWNLENTCSSCTYKPCRAVILWVPFSEVFKRVQTLFLNTVEYHEEMIIRYMETLLKDHALFIFFTHLIYLDLDFTELETVWLFYGFSSQCAKPLATINISTTHHGGCSLPVSILSTHYNSCRGNIRAEKCRQCSDYLKAVIESGNKRKAIVLTSIQHKEGSSSNP